MAQSASVGTVGAVGYIGTVDTVGTVGYVGSVGYIGAVGYVGSVGTVDSVGTVGAIGYVGSIGTVGSVGYVGSVGTIGYVGSVGTVGSVGNVDLSQVLQFLNVDELNRIQIQSSVGETTVMFTDILPLWGSLSVGVFFKYYTLCRGSGSSSFRFTVYRIQIQSSVGKPQ